MHITFLGHAGFCVETEESIIIMDPWLSTFGAFDSAWFQYPRNHHLAELVQDKLRNPIKDKYIYISHEHKDHFDLPFLNSLKSRDFTLLIPHFRRPALRDMLSQYECKGMKAFKHGEAFALPDGYVQLYLDDSDLNRDSAILIKSRDRAFLNINDCKIHDYLIDIKNDNGEVDIFACQYSGATWHPTCYDYPKEVYESISKKKAISKFESTARAIETLQPKLYLASAGPACFLDPMLFHLNFEEVNIFPRIEAFLTYLEKRLRKTASVQAPVMMPGDVIDGQTCQFLSKSSIRVMEENHKVYLESYAAEYAEHFKNQKDRVSEEDRPVILERLKAELERKLSHFTLADRLARPLYMRFHDTFDQMIKLDFKSRQVSITQDKKLCDDFYMLEVPSWQIDRVLEREITWEDLALTFRVKLRRSPDTYQTLMQGFLILEAEDLSSLCETILEFESSQEKILVEAGGCRYSVNRICPHQGGDLKTAWIEEDRYLICPKHRWRFDLHRDGQCEQSDSSIHAVVVEDAPHRSAAPPCNSPLEPASGTRDSA